MRSPATLRQWVVEGKYPTVAAEDFRTPHGIPVERYDEDARAGHVPIRLHAAATVSFDPNNPKRCYLLNGDEKQKDEFRSLEKKAAQSGRPVCLAPCPQTWCVSHPAQLHYLKAKGWVPAVHVRTHKARKIRPTKLGLLDEAPDAIKIVTLTIESINSEYAVQPVEVLLALLEAAGLDAYARELRRARNALVDACGHVSEKYDSDVYQVRPLPKLSWDTSDFDEIENVLKDGRRVDVLASVREKMGISDNFDLKVDDALDAVRSLFSGDDALWSYSPNRKTLVIYMPVNTWKDRAFGTWLTAVFDGTAIGHYSYAAIPSEFQTETHWFERPEYPKTTFVFGQKMINKGSGDENAREQAQYALDCLRELQRRGHEGDVLIVTHKKAARVVEKAIKNDAEIVSAFKMAGEDRQGDCRTLYLAHFGALKGSSSMRSTTAVIITHRHNLQHADAVARAMAVFGTVHVLRPGPGGKLIEAPLARQWTPWRRGKSGKNKDEKAVFSQQFDVIHSREVGYVMSSHLICEIVQAILRCKLRDDRAAKVIVFVPLGEDTTTMAAILREFPGARVEDELEGVQPEVDGAVSATVTDDDVAKLDRITIWWMASSLQRGINNREWGQAQVRCARYVQQIPREKKVEALMRALPNVGELRYQQAADQLLLELYPNQWSRVRHRYAA